MKKIVFTGGGTLGHVMPNLYLYEDLKNEYTAIYIGSKGIEKERVKKIIENYKEIDTVKFVRGKFFTNLKIPFVLICAIVQAKKELKSFNPDIVFSKGGYVSLPVCIAARMLKIPIIAHESDSTLGLANKIILRLCDKMCVSFSNTINCVKGKNKQKIVYTGPILSKMYDIKTSKFKYDFDKDKPVLLICGGSLGSQKINEMIYPILRELKSNFNIIHLTGKGNIKIKSHDNYIAMESCDDMVSLYNISDIMIGRCGAGVSAECFYKKIPMLLIPLENKASRGDQVLNARYYKNLGVAEIVREADLTPMKLLNSISEFNSKLTHYKSVYKNISITNGRDKTVAIIKNQK